MLLDSRDLKSYIQVQFDRDYPNSKPIALLRYFFCLNTRVTRQKQNSFSHCYIKDEIYI